MGPIAPQSHWVPSAPAHKATPKTVPPIRRPDQQKTQIKDHRKKKQLGGEGEGKEMQKKIDCEQNLCGRGEETERVSARASRTGPNLDNDPWSSVGVPIHRPICHLHSFHKSSLSPQLLKQLVNQHCTGPLPFGNNNNNHLLQKENTNYKKPFLKHRFGKFYERLTEKPLVYE